MNPLPEGSGCCCTDDLLFFLVELEDGGKGEAESAEDGKNESKDEGTAQTEDVVLGEDVRQIVQQHEDDQGEGDDGKNERYIFQIADPEEGECDGKDGGQNREEKHPGAGILATDAVDDGIDDTDDGTGKKEVGSKALFGEEFLNFVHLRVPPFPF